MRCASTSWRLAAPEVLYIVNDSQAKVLVVGPDFVPVLDAIADDLTHVTKIVVIPGADGAAHPVHESYDQWVDRYEPVDPGTVSAMDDVAFQLYSSGTTGCPKGVMLANENFFALLPMAKEIWELTPDSVKLVGLIADLKISHALLVLVALQSMLMVPGIEDADFSSLEIII